MRTIDFWAGLAALLLIGVLGLLMLALEWAGRRLWIWSYRLGSPDRVRLARLAMTPIGQPSRASGSGNEMRLPTVNEINVFGTLDEMSAAEHFLGKTCEEAEALFRENSLAYLEDLLWMGPQAFCFYAPAAVTYLRSSAAAGSPDDINSFIGIVEFRLQEQRSQIAPSLPSLRAAARYVLDHWEDFEVDPAIYGNLRERYGVVARQLQDNERSHMER
jgi:hypothetical protein